MSTSDDDSKRALFTAYAPSSALAVLTTEAYGGHNVGSGKTRGIYAYFPHPVFFSVQSWASWTLLLGIGLILGLANLLLLVQPTPGPGEPGVLGRPSRNVQTAPDIIGTHLTAGYPSQEFPHDSHNHYEPVNSFCPLNPLLSFQSTNYCCGNPRVFMSDDMSSSSMSPTVAAAVGISRAFDYPAEHVQQGVKEYIREMYEGLSQHGATLSQIPTYVTNVPNGTEKGLYLAVDLGGTNFRVCSVELKGDHTFSLTQSKVAIPRELMVARTYKELFQFLAKQIEAFLEEHHNEHFEAHVRRRRLSNSREAYKEEEIFDLGFTFSFPVQQSAINRGTLIRWTKGFNIPDAIGEDVCLMLQDAIDELHLPVRVAALVNDTVGTLMARSYTSPGKTKTLVGAIFGTGTNGAYVERLNNVTKLGERKEGTDVQEEMVINTEWGSFDNHLSVLPDTPYDRELDAESNNPGIQMFEKRVSGMFLGEVLRRTLLGLYRDSAVDFLKSGGTTIGEKSPLYEIWGIDTSFLSLVEADATPDLQAIAEALKKDLHVDNASLADRQAVKTLVHAIGKRAARLSAIPLGAILMESGQLKTEDTVDIGVDGSLVEFYPGFVEYLREALREIPEIGAEGEKKVRIGIAKDGSGVGAALIALVARSGNAIEETQ